jgi:hypothetical protein
VDVMRVMQGTTRVVTLRLSDDGTPIDPDGDALSVSATNDAGASVMDATAATRVEAGEYTVPLTPSQTSTLDLLTLQWEGEIAGVAYVSRSLVEVVGGYWFTVPAMRQQPGISMVLTDEEIAASRTSAEEFLEDQAHRSYVPRYRREQHRLAAGDETILLERPDLTSVRSLSVDGTALTTDQLDALDLDTAGIIDLACNALALSGDPLDLWRRHRPRHVEVAYEYGLPSPTVIAQRAALVLARHWLINGPLDARAIGVPVEGGGVVPLLTPGVRGSITGLPEVDVFLQQRADRVPGVG